MTINQQEKEDTSPERKALEELERCLSDSEMSWWARFRFWIRGEPRYCKVCGKMLEYGEQVESYNKKTGLPNKWLCWIDCPDWRLTCGLYSLESNGHEDFRWTERE